MKSLITKIAATMLLTLFVAPINAQVTTAAEAGQVGYPGSFTIADMMADHIAKTHEVDPDAIITFTVSIPVIKENHVLVKDLSGLPMPKSADEEARTNASIKIPFAVADFKAEGEFDSLSFFDHVSNSLERLTVPPSRQGKSKKSGSSAQIQGLEDHPSCGGYPVGSSFSHTTTSCYFGTVSNTYTCQSNPATGGKDWFITSSYSIPPNISECIGDI